MSRENDRVFDVRALEAFDAAMSSGSMTAAGRRLGIGQPAVTRLVRELESDVGFQLFHRNGPRISPTDRGLRFYEEVQRVIAGLHQIRGRADAIRDERLPALDIAATPTMAGGLIGPTLQALGGDLPDHVNVQTMNAAYVVRGIRSRTCDFGVAAYPLDHMGLERHVICESQLVAVVSTATPEAHRDGMLPLSLLDGARLITVGNAYRIRHTIDTVLAEQGISPAQTLSTNSSLNAVMAARSGLGVAIVDPVTAFGIPVKGVAVLPLSTAIPYFWGLFSDTARAFAPSQMRFVEAFRTACQGTIPDCTFHDPQDPGLLKRIGQLLRTSP
ncbi:MAG: LysR family transcriptional regulator [Tropicimonas sp.]|uniref:LysR family transcriptional regulator n=1 Tax=Tropicimonas sp. TaxID=2067044 RepID=UPI003A837323